MDYRLMVEETGGHWAAAALTRRIGVDHHRELTHPEAATEPPCRNRPGDLRRPDRGRLLPADGFHRRPGPVGTGPGVREGQAARAGLELPDPIPGAAPQQ